MGFLANHYTETSNMVNAALVRPLSWPDQSIAANSSPFDAGRYDPRGPSLAYPYNHFDSDPYQMQQSLAFKPGLAFSSWQPASTLPTAPPINPFAAPNALGFSAHALPRAASAPFQYITSDIPTSFFPPPDLRSISLDSSCTHVAAAQPSIDKFATLHPRSSATLQSNSFGAPSTSSLPAIFSSTLFGSSGSFDSKTNIDSGHQATIGRTFDAVGSAASTPGNSDELGLLAMVAEERLNHGDGDLKDDGKGQADGLDESHRAGKVKDKDSMEPRA